ncbi:MAG: MgtC/SapB family protein [candidate division WS1 bacterium]|jgi:putative Mg2+ transporter-C (MgtC) family protein|nr:MgtC/SapB family protein [candidate division WS1 bacterium]
MNGGETLPDFVFHDWHNALLRLALALLAGAIIGMDREWRNKPAGLRTHAVVSMAACLAMMISIAMHATTGAGGNIAYGVVTGIGFLGGGAILRYGRDVRGLVTGASIWSSAVIGLGFGLGWYAVASAATVLILGSLWGLQYVEMLLNPSQGIVVIRATTEPGAAFPKKLFMELPELQFEVKAFDFDPGFGDDTGCLCLEVKTPSHLSGKALLSMLKTEEWVKDAEIVDGEEV